MDTTGRGRRASLWDSHGVFEAAELGMSVRPRSHRHAGVEPSRGEVHRGAMLAKRLTKLNSRKAWLVFFVILPLNLSGRYMPRRIGLRVGGRKVS